MLNLASPSRKGEIPRFEAKYRLMRTFSSAITYNPLRKATPQSMGGRRLGAIRIPVIATFLSWQAQVLRSALRFGALLVIVNQGETPMDRNCHLRFEERIGEVLPPTISKLKELMKN